MTRVKLALLETDFDFDGEESPLSLVDELPQEPLMAREEFDREAEGDSSPRDYAEEALEHFMRAADLMDVPDETLERDTKRAKDACSRRKCPSLPNILVASKN
jgi:hypothetical protein